MKHQHIHLLRPVVRLLLALLFLCPTLLLPAQARLSERARISLMTVAPGDMLYSTFGHSALRVYDPDTGFDRCYNYGTFDFDQPNFLLKFCQGRLLYFLNVEPYRAFEYGNLLDRRPMKEQFLNMSAEKRQRLFDLLQENARTENRYYKYEFFYDNCATRIRDILNEAYFYQLQYDSSALPLGETTMRDLLHQYLVEMPWTEFGIDLVLGIPADRIALTADYMFLPDYLHDLIGSAKLPDGVPLVQVEENIPANPLPARDTYEPGFFGRPLWVMLLVAAIGLLCMANPRAERIFDTLFWFVLGISGLIIFLLWVATDHQATKFNLNILWALPTHLLFFWRTRQGPIAETYIMVTGALAALTLLFWGFLPQNLPETALPIVVLVIVKGFFRRWVTDSSVFRASPRV